MKKIVALGAIAALAGGMIFAEPVFEPSVTLSGDILSEIASFIVMNKPPRQGILKAGLIWPFVTCKGSVPKKMKRAEHKF